MGQQLFLVREAHAAVILAGGFVLVHTVSVTTVVTEVRREGIGEIVDEVVVGKQPRELGPVNEGWQAWDCVRVCMEVCVG